MDPKQIPDDYQVNEGVAAVIRNQNQNPQRDIPIVNTASPNIDYPQGPMNTHQPMMFVLEPVPPGDYPMYYSQPPPHPDGYNPSGPAYQPYEQPAPHPQYASAQRAKENNQENNGDASGVHLNNEGNYQV